MLSGKFLYMVMGGMQHGTMVDQRYDDRNVQGHDMMALLAQRNMMASQLVRQVSHPPPTYNLAETFSGLSLSQAYGQPRYRSLNQSGTQHSSPGCSYPVPPPVPVSSKVLSMPVTQQMPSSTFSLFPSTATMSDISKPILAVPPVYRGSGDTQY